MQNYVSALAGLSTKSHTLFGCLYLYDNKRFNSSRVMIGKHVVT